MILYFFRFQLFKKSVPHLKNRLDFAWNRRKSGCNLSIDSIY